MERGKNENKEDGELKLIVSDSWGVSRVIPLFQLFHPLERTRDPFSEEHESPRCRDSQRKLVISLSVSNTCFDTDLH